MEAVRTFNNELSSLYECKPPISRAKMATVTKCAIKAIKFYKHVVQSVEKFIQKCKPEYKVPGLYVIDSVVRQSRHQFGSQKDVFAPRFTKNIIATFQNLFKCPGDERSKIVRVLNLWQKNEVFPSEIVQPLLDLAADPTKPSLIAAAQAAVDTMVAASGKPASSQHVHQNPPQQPQHHQPAQDQAPGPKDTQEDSGLSQSAAESMLATQNDMLNTVTQLLQQTDTSNTSLSAQQQQLQQLQLLQQQLIQQTQLMQQPTGAPIIDSNLLAQIQALTNQLLSKTDTKPEGGERFNKNERTSGIFQPRSHQSDPFAQLQKLLDFDYGESDEEDDRRQHQGETNVAGNVQTILNDSSLMQQIHQVSQNIQSNDQMRTELQNEQEQQRRRVLEQQQAEFDQQIAQGMPPPPPFSAQQPPPVPEESFREEGEYEEEQLMDEDFRDHQQMRDRDDRDRRDRRRRSRDRSRTPKRRRRSRSRSRDRRRRSRSRDRDRDRHRRSKSKDKEREKQKEKERERKKKALPPLRENCLAVCTTTIWIGHLNKFTQEEELKAELERYGPVDNISMVPPRGCAYVVMSHRKDAHKAIDRLKGYKLNGSALKTAWAQSTGMREAEYKDGWDVESGVKYIPWDRLPMDLSLFLEGAILDADSLPEHLKGIPTEKGKLGQQDGMAGGDGTQHPQMGMAGSQQAQMPGLLGMMPGAGVMPPGMPGMMPGMVMPMQRPMVPGMPPQSMAMNPGAPPQMLPGGPQIPGMPGAPVPPGMNPLSIANTSASAVPPTLQNVVVSGAVPNSPAVAARAGFPPGAAPPRFGFNPNLPPPGFRLPPPGFGIRPMMPNVPNSAPDTPGKMGDTPTRMDGTKQPEMVWPPDSNEKDEDEEEEEMGENTEKSGESGPLKSRFDSPQNLPMPPGPLDPSAMRMLGPRPPGGFPPPGPMDWAMMRMGGPRGPDMFNNMPPMMGPRGPRFMGNRMGMPGGPWLPMGRGGPMRPPVSLLDLDIKPPEKFEGETFENEDDKADNVENSERNAEESEQNNEENEEGEERSGGYPFNNWQSVNRDRHRDDDRNRDRNSDRHRDRDRSDSRNRDRDRDDGRSRGWDRDRDRNWDRDDDRYRDQDRRDSRDRDRDRDRSRGDRDRDRDWRKRDDHRGRDRKEERERTRPSRWSDADEVTKQFENSSENVPAIDEEPPQLTPEPPQLYAEPPQLNEELPKEAEAEPELEPEPVSETMEFSADEGEIIETTGNAEGNPSMDEVETKFVTPETNFEEADTRTEEAVAPEIESDNNIPVESNHDDVQNNVNDEIAADGDGVNILASDEIDVSAPPSTNGPVSTDDVVSTEDPVSTDDVSTEDPVSTEDIVPSSKLETIKQDEASSPSQIKSDNSENKENEENVELEEGEIAS